MCAYIRAHTYIYIMYICIHVYTDMYVCIYIYIYQLSVRRRTNQSIDSIVFPKSAPAVAYAAAVVSAAAAVRAALSLLEFQSGL